MIRFAISLATIILVAGFLLSGFALTHVIIANYSVEGRVNWIAVAQSVSPFILAAGVLVAWAALQSNIRHSREQRAHEESAFFFRECKENFDEIISLLMIRAPEQADIFHGVTRVNLKQDLEQTAAVLADVGELSASISEQAFLRAYERRREDLKRRLYDMFGRLTLQDLTRIELGPGNGDVDARIERYNAAIVQKLEKASDASLAAELREQVRQKDRSTPFPNGVPTRTIWTIIAFFDPEAVKSRDPGELRQLGPRLAVVEAYLGLCERYDNIDGKLLRKSVS